MSTRPQYIALSGAVADDPDSPPPRFDEPENERCCNCCGGFASNGIFSRRGIVSPDGPSKMSSVTDGLSHTALLGEASTFYFDTVGTPHEIYGRSGIIMGVDRVGARAARHFHATTVRYRINANSARIPGVDYNFGSNLPLASSHPGGVHVALGDGAVLFVTDSMDLITLKRLATKDDGDVVSGND